MSTALAILPRIWACQAPLEALEPQLVEPLPQPQPTEPIPPRLAFYRKYTEAMLRRYMRFSLEAGRVPSMLGRELFRGKVTSYQVHSFEDVVIFVSDMERCLGRLDHIQQLLITRIAIQEYTREETAELLKISLRTVIRRYNRSVDRLTGILLDGGMLEPLKACQGGSEPI